MRYRTLKENRHAAGVMFQRGASDYHVARYLGAQPETTRRWYFLWRRYGLRGLDAVRRRGPRPKLSAGGLAAMKPYILYGPQSCGIRYANYWDRDLLAQTIFKMTGVRYRASYIPMVLRKMRLKLVGNEILPL